MKITNRIRECDDGKQRHVLPEKRKLIVMHRFGGPTLPDVVDAPGISTFYRDNPQYTGGQAPYTLVGLPTGEVEQALELNDVGPHAKRWNTPGIGVAAIGDFRTERPSAFQWSAMIEVVGSLLCYLQTPAVSTLFGHDELDNASSDPSKACPGMFWPMAQFRDECQRKALQVEARLAIHHPEVGEKPDSEYAALLRELELLRMGLVF